MWGGSGKAQRVAEAGRTFLVLRSFPLGDRENDGLKRQWRRGTRGIGTQHQMEDGDGECDGIDEERKEEKEATRREKKWKWKKHRNRFW